jgi:hypothetical protein
MGILLSSCCFSEINSGCVSSHTCVCREIYYGLIIKFRPCVGERKREIKTNSKSFIFHVLLVVLPMTSKRVYGHMFTFLFNFLELIMDVSVATPDFVGKFMC